MKYLVDANVWLQPVVGLQEAASVIEMLIRVPRGLLAVTDFTLHSIALRIASARPDQFHAFLDDLLQKQVNTLHLAAADLHTVVQAMQRHALDFDDAMQYVAAERYDLRIVSFDTDFDRTPRGRLTVAQVLVEHPR